MVFNNMATSRKFFQDHLVLLLISVQGFLVLLNIAIIFLRLIGSHSNSYIVQYRSTLGIGSFKTGTVIDLLSFIVFALMIFIFNFLLSIRTYPINRLLTVTILGLGILLTSLSIIISNALLVFH